MSAIAIPSPALVQAILFLIAAQPVNQNGLPDQHLRPTSRRPAGSK